MKKHFLSFSLAFFMVTFSYGQMKVANYSVGKFGTEAYEEFSFWVMDEKKELMSLYMR